MAEKRQKKQAVKAFEKETFSKDKEVTGVKHIEHRQDNTFSVENQFSASEKPVSNLSRDANHGSRTRNATSGHSVQKSEAEAEKSFLKENSFMQDEQTDYETSSDSTIENKVHVRDTFQRSEEKGKYHKGRVQRELRHNVIHIAVVGQPGVDVGKQTVVTAQMVHIALRADAELRGRPCLFDCLIDAADQLVDIFPPPLGDA